MDTATLQAAISTLSTAGSEQPKTPTTQANVTFHYSDTWRRKFIGLDETNQRVKSAAMACEKFAKLATKNADNDRRWLILGGMTGCGKTSMAKAVHRYFRSYASDEYHAGAWGYRGRLPESAFLAWPKVADIERDEWNGTWYDAQDSDLLVIDDLGAETDQYRSQVPITRLQTILEAKERKWLLVTSNVPKAKWEAKWGERVSSRLHAAAYISLFDVPDWRKKT